MNLSPASGESCSNFEVHKCKVDNLVTVMILKLIQKATNKIATMDFMKNGYRRIPIFDNDCYVCDDVFVLGYFKKEKFNHDYIIINQFIYFIY